jgi:uncharacterized membrane protein YtjA (UPF0391 family)
LKRLDLKIACTVSARLQRSIANSDARKSQKLIPVQRTKAYAWYRLSENHFNKKLLSFQSDQGVFMLHYSVIFLVIALIAAIFGFGGIAAGAVEIAKILFVIFAIMAVITFVISLLKK